MADDDEQEPLRSVGLQNAQSILQARRRAEEALRQSEHFLKRVTDVVPGVIQVFDLDEQRCVFMNRSVASALGYGAEEVLAMGSSVVQRLMHVDDRPRFEQHMQRLRVLGDQDTADFEHRMLDRSGQWRWFHSRDAVFARDGDGRVRQIIGAAIDITERKRAEQALSDAALRMRLATEATAVGIWEWNLASNEIRWDAQMFRIYGVTPTAGGIVAYSTWSDAVEPEDLARQEGLMRETIRGLGSGRREFRIRRPGEAPYRVIQAVEAARRNPQGQAEWVVGTNLDITESKRIDDDLRQAERRKDNFIATLAHELRNPLAPIRNAVHIMRQKAPADARLAWCGDVIERQVRQMARLLEDLLDISRITQGKFTLRRDQVALAAVVEQAVEIARPFIDAAGHVLTLSLPSEPMVFDGDATRLAQVVANLLINAAKYTADHGQIGVTAQREGAELVLRVIDNGVGIDAEHLSSIFDMFTQVQPTLARAQGGLGIGLALVKGLVEMHGGQVSAFSRGLGQGSEFAVRLPLHEPPVPAPGSAGAPAAPAPAHCRILVADDSHDTADSLAMLLRLSGHTVHVAHDGQQALAMAEAQRPQLALLDIGMPLLNGYETCRRIREQPWGQAMTLVAQTGWGQEEDRRRAREAGFDHHLIKPVDVNELEAILRSVVARTDG